jgi:hypothetical protein
MGRLSDCIEFIEAQKSGVSQAGEAQPTCGWEIGIPIDSLKQIDRCKFAVVGSGAGAVVTVWGSMVTKFDNPTPSFDVSSPVTNGNPFTSISGTLKKQNSSQQLSMQTAIFGGGARVGTHVGITGSGISNTANEVWDYKYTYTLT